MQTAVVGVVGDGRGRQRAWSARLAVCALAAVLVGVVAPGEAGAQTNVVLSPASVAFDPQDVGTTGTSQPVTVNALGRITVISVEGDFVRTGGSCEIDVFVAPAAPCDVLMAFAPTGEGPATGLLTVVVDNSFVGDATLSGQGTVATTTVPTTTTPTTTATTDPEPPSTTRQVLTTTSVPGATTTATTTPLQATTSVATTTTTRPPVPASRPVGPTLTVTAAGGGRSGPPGVGLTIAGSGYRSPGGNTLGGLVLVASPALAQAQAQAQAQADCDTVYFFQDDRRIGTAVPRDDGGIRRSGLSVPGNTRPALHTVTSACRPSGAPVLASADFVVTNASVHRSALATSLPGPGQVDLSPRQIALSMLAVMALIVLIAFPGELFNTTLEEHYDEVRGWFHLGPRTRKAGGTRNVLLFVTFLALSGPMWFAMQSSSRSDAATAIAALGLSLATAIVILGSDVPTLIHLRRHDALDAGLVALPGTLLLTVGCILLSRAVHFEPGYFYGLVGGIVIGTQIRRETAGRLAATCTGLMLVLSVGAWIALGPVSEAARQSDAGVVPILAESVLGGIFWAALDILVIALLPLRLLLGSKVVGWSRKAWVVLYGLTLLAFVHILLRPGTGYVSETAVSAPLVAFALFTGFAAFSFAFWGYFRFRRPRHALVPLDNPPPVSPRTPAGGTSELQVEPHADPDGGVGAMSRLRVSDGEEAGADLVAEQHPEAEVLPERSVPRDVGEGGQGETPPAG